MRFVTGWLKSISLALMPAAASAGRTRWCSVLPDRSHVAACVAAR
jgi:hypothetical protein